MTCPRCAALQADFDEAVRLLQWVLAELQSMEAGADPKFQKFVGKLVEIAREQHES